MPSINLQWRWLQSWKYTEEVFNMNSYTTVGCMKKDPVSCWFCLVALKTHMNRGCYFQKLLAKWTSLAYWHSCCFEPLGKQTNACQEGWGNGRMISASIVLDTSLCCCSALPALSAFTQQYSKLTNRKRTGAQTLNYQAGGGGMGALNWKQWPQAALEGRVA